MALGGASGIGGMGGGLDTLAGLEKSLGAGGAAPAAKPASGFGDILKTKLGELNATQADSSKAMTEIATGRVDDVAQTMMRIEQANVQLQMATQFRNKVVEAYQEILRMQM